MKKASVSTLIHNKRKSLLFELAEVRYKNYTQAELAAKLNMSQTVVSRFECGRVSPSLDTFIKFAEALDVEVVLRYKNGKNIDYS